MAADLVTTEESTDTAPPDTALPDTAPPDTALPDTELPDTELPDGDPADTDETAATDLGVLERSFGTGWAALQAAAHLPPEDSLGGPWRVIPISEEVAPRVCPSPALGGAERMFMLQTPEALDSGYPPVVEVAVETHEDAEAAQRRMEFLDSDDYARCAEMSTDAVDLRPFELAIDDHRGLEVEPEVDRIGARTFVATGVVTGPGLELDIQLASTFWTEGSHVYEISIAHLIDAPPPVDARTIANLMEAGDRPSADRADLDAAADALRRAALVDGPATPQWGLSGAASLAPTYNPQVNVCLERAGSGPVPATIAVLDGPLWVSARGASGTVQRGAAFASADDAAELLDIYRTFGADCLIEGYRPYLGDIDVEEPDVGIEERRGREVLVISVPVTQLATTPGVAIDADVRIMLTLARTDTTVVGWEFGGFAGDEPDLVDLTVQALEQVERRP